MKFMKTKTSEKSSAVVTADFLAWFFLCQLHRPSGCKALLKDGLWVRPAQQLLSQPENHWTDHLPLGLSWVTVSLQRVQNKKKGEGRGGEGMEGKGK